MTRKIIRISVVVLEDGDEHPYVLCDDGTVWYYGGIPNRWINLPPIPQDEKEKEGPF
jgi:hypothetical protein